MGSQVQIIPATLEDLPDLVRLEEACFSAPWTRKMLAAELIGNRFAHFLVARDPGSGGVIVGYLCYWIVFEEVRLMNLAVIDGMRRRGIAASLVEEALRTGRAQSATRAVLEVRASNHAALALYRRFGFVDVSIRRNYYANPIEDAVLMELEPIPAGTSSGHDRASAIDGGSIAAH